jgi:hypothetical protein
MQMHERRFRRRPVPFARPAILVVGSTHSEFETVVSVQVLLLHCQKSSCATSFWPSSQWSCPVVNRGVAGSSRQCNLYPCQVCHIEPEENHELFTQGQLGLETGRPWERVISSKLKDSFALYRLRAIVHPTCGLVGVAVAQ